MKRILYAEDTRDASVRIERDLCRAGCTVQLIVGCPQGRRPGRDDTTFVALDLAGCEVLIDPREYDAAILDGSLLNCHGLHFCRMLVRFGLFVVAASSMAEDNEKMTGEEGGAELAIPKSGFMDALMGRFDPSECIWPTGCDQSRRGETLRKFDQHFRRVNCCPFGCGSGTL